MICKLKRVFSVGILSAAVSIAGFNDTPQAHAQSTSSAGCTLVNSGALNQSVGAGASGTTINQSAQFNVGDRITVDLLNAANSLALLGALVIFSGNTGSQSKTVTVPAGGVYAMASDIIAVLALSASIVWRCTPAATTPTPTTPTTPTPTTPTPTTPTPTTPTPTTPTPTTPAPTSTADDVRNQATGLSDMLNGISSPGGLPTRLTTPAPINPDAFSDKMDEYDAILRLMIKYQEGGLTFSDALDVEAVEVALGVNRSGVVVEGSDNGLVRRSDGKIVDERQTRSIIGTLRAIEDINNASRALIKVRKNYEKLKRNFTQDNIDDFEDAIEEFNRERSQLFGDSRLFDSEFKQDLPRLDGPDTSRSSSEGEAILYTARPVIKPTPVQKALTNNFAQTEENFALNYTIPGYAFISADGRIKSQIFVQARYSEMLNDVTGSGFSGRVGVLTSFGEKLIGGLYINGSKGDTTIKSTNFNLERSGLGLGAYTAYNVRDDFELTAGIAYNGFNNDVATNGGVTGSYDSSLLTGNAGFNSKHAMGSAQLMLSSSIGFAITKSDAYTMSDATSIASTSRTALTARSSARLSQTYNLSSTAFETITPYLTGGLSYNSQVSDINAAGVQVVDFNSLSASIGAGFSFANDNGTSLAIGGQIGGLGNSAQSASATIRLTIPLQ